MSIADKGARMGNFMFDSLLFFIILAVSTYFLFLPFTVPMNQKVNITSIYSAVLYFGYYFLFEYLFGKTPGKFLTKTVTVDRNGRKPSCKDLVIRTLLRLTPYDYLSFLFGQGGLHDSLSKTMVIAESDLQYREPDEDNTTFTAGRALAH